MRPARLTCKIPHHGLAVEEPGRERRGGVHFAEFVSEKDAETGALGGENHLEIDEIGLRIKLSGCMYNPRRMDWVLCVVINVHFFFLTL